VAGLTNEELRLRRNGELSRFLARPGARGDRRAARAFLAVIDRVVRRHGPTHRRAPRARDMSPSPWGSIRAGLAVALGI